MARKKKLKFHYVVREDFIKKRYENFLVSKKNLATYPPELQKFCHITNLDHNYGDGPMKDFIICDRCNEYIKDETFVMMENQFVYHRECIKNEDWFDKNQPDTNPECGFDFMGELSNVIPIFKKE